MTNRLRLRINYIYALICLTVIPNFPISHALSDVQNITNLICNSYNCYDRARYIKESLDESADPCKDFYQYACGGWLKKNPVPPTQMEYSMETYLKMTIIKKLKVLLEKPNHSMDTKDVRNAKKVYYECMRTHLLQRTDAKVIRSHIIKLEYWPLCFVHNSAPRPHWIDVLKYYLQLTGEASLFDIRIGIDTKNNPIIQLEEIKEPFAMLSVMNWTMKKEEYYSKFLKELVKNLQLFDQSNCDIDDRIEEIIKFRHSLEQILTETSEHSVEFYYTTINNLQKFYNAKRLPAKAKIPWLEVIYAAFHIINGKEVDGSTEIKIVNKEYFLALAELLSKTPLNVIVNHIHLYFVEMHMKMSKKLKKLLEKIVLIDETFYDEIIWDKDKLWICIQNHPMDETLAKMYNMAYWTKEVEEEVTNIAEDIKKILRLQMSASEWLPTAKKFEIGEKLARTRLFFGITEGNKITNHPWLNNKQLKLEWQRIVSVMPEASYVLSSEQVLIGTGYMQRPFYNEDLPYVVNYGSIGSLLGHEFFHTFQTALSEKYMNSKGIKKEEHTISEMYNRKAECFMELYKTNTVKDLNDLPSSIHVKPNMIRTLDENIADTMGLKAAYGAYKNKLFDSNNVCPILPIKPELSCDELFFVSFALTFCGNIPPAEIRKMLKKLSHLPPRMRVNGAVSNMRAFSEAFRCGKKTSLNPARKCDLWI